MGQRVNEGLRGFPMNVFISWSGGQSSKFAKAFSDWLPNVFQSVTPFYSPKDIVAGEGWFERLTKVLEEYDFGIVCLTSENLTAPWLMFESGALAKRLGKAKLVPVLCGVTETELSKNPLSHFQYVHTDKDEIRKLVDSINASLEDYKLGESQLTRAFEKWWPDLESDIAKALAYKEGAPKKPIDMNAAVEEMLSILRSLARREIPVNNALVRSYLFDLANTWSGNKEPQNPLMQYIDGTTGRVRQYRTGDTGALPTVESRADLINALRVHLETKESQPKSAPKAETKAQDDDKKKGSK
jgi:hypothetical protein